VAEITRQLRAQAGGAGKEAARQRKRLGEIDRQIARLVEAIATAGDVPELAKRLGDLKAEQAYLQAELRRQRALDGTDIEAQAEAPADRIWGLDKIVATADAPTLRELLGELVERIECRWDGRRSLTRGRKRCTLTSLTVEVPDLLCFAGFGTGVTTLRGVKRCEEPCPSCP
jgi:hypothetical protein